VPQSFLCGCISCSEAAVHHRWLHTHFGPAPEAWLVLTAAGEYLRVKHLHFVVYVRYSAAHARSAVSICLSLTGLTRVVPVLCSHTPTKPTIYRSFPILCHRHVSFNSFSSSCRGYLCPNPIHQFPRVLLLLLLSSGSAAPLRRLVLHLQCSTCLSSSCQFRIPFQGP
jgi:hypothetical protein